MRRGEVWWANLPEPRGPEPGFPRPVLIVQRDDLNRSRLKTVLVVMITSNPAQALVPWNVLLSSEESSLPRDSVVNVTQIMTLDRTELVERVGRVSVRLMRYVDDGLRLALALDDDR